MSVLQIDMNQNKNRMLSLMSATTWMAPSINVGNILTFYFCPENVGFLDIVRETFEAEGCSTTCSFMEI